MAATKEVLEKGEDMVIIDVPEDIEGGSNTLIVGVNCKVWKLMRGRQTKVPRSVAEVIMNAQDADREARSRIQVLVEQAAKKAKA